MKKYIQQLALCLAMLIFLCSLRTVSAMASAPLKITTEILPKAMAGEAYTAKILCNEADAVFAISAAFGRFNDFGKTGLTLSEDGTISGTPMEPGVYRFSIVATGAAGADYRVYTLVVEGSSTGETTEPEVTITEPVTTEPITEPVTTEPITEPVTTEPVTEPDATESITEPETTEPITEPTTTEPTTEPETAPTEATPIEPATNQTPEAKPDTFPWLAVALVGIAGVGVAVILLKKK